MKFETLIKINYVAIALWLVALAVWIYASVI